MKTPTIVTTEIRIIGNADDAAGCDIAWPA